MNGRHGLLRLARAGSLWLMPAAIVLLSARSAAGQPVRSSSPFEQRYRFHVGSDLPMLAADGIWSGIAMGHDGSIYAADASDWRVVRFRKDGELLGTWGGPGAGFGEMGTGCMTLALPKNVALCGPSDVAIGPSGDVFTADALNGRIQRFTPWGAFVSRWCVLGVDPADPTACRRPDGVADWSLAIGPDGRMYVSRAAADESVVVLDADGRRVASWPIAAGDLAATADGRIVAAVPSESRIKVLDSSGRVLRELGHFGECLTGGGAIGGPVFAPCNPAGVSVGSDGAIYAVEAQAFGSPGDQVVRFAPDGSASVLVSGAAAEAAMRIAVAEDGALYLPLSKGLNAGGIAVVDALGKRVATWRMAPRAVEPLDERGHAAFADPLAVAPAGDGVVVVDRWGHRLQWIGREGELVRGDVSVAAGVPPLRYPVAIAAAPGGAWVAADAAAADVRLVAANGALGGRWGGRTVPGDPAGGLDRPEGVAVVAGTDDEPRLFVSDAGAHRIVRFAWDGAFETAWSMGPGGLALDTPGQMAAAPDGTLWVVDAGNARVAHFASDGAPLGAVDGAGSAGGALRGPAGVAVGPDGTLRVSDSLDGQDGRIRAFSPDGTALAEWSGDGPPGTRLVHPAGLAFGADGTLWAADEWRGRVVAFGREASADWHVQVYRDGALMDGPVVVLSLPTLDLDWAGRTPWPGMSASGFSLRAERAVGPGSPWRRLSVTLRGGATLIAPHGQPSIVVSGDPGQAVVHRTLRGGEDWLRVDFAARSTRPMLRLADAEERRAFLPAVLDRIDVRGPAAAGALGPAACPAFDANAPVH